MNTLDGRLLVYAALVILCSAASVFLGLVAGFWSFVQIVVVIELMYSIRTLGRNHSAKNW
jgi:hypothetical protein